MESSDKPGNGGSGTSAGKALALLDVLGGPRSVLGVSELADRASLSKSTAYRLLLVLVERGWVTRVGDRYTLAPRVFELGNQVRVARPNGIRDRAMPFLAELFARTRETVHLGVLDGTDVVYIEKLFGHESTRLDTVVGSRRPAYATALGKAMLASSTADVLHQHRRRAYRRYTPYTIATAAGLERSLQKVRSEGWATDFEESFLGVSCLAVPVIDPQTGTAVAAISVSTAKPGLHRFGAALQGAAEQLSRQLGPRVAA